MGYFNINEVELQELHEAFFVLEDLLNCTELNLDDMEEDTKVLVQRARGIIATARGEAYD